LQLAEKAITDPLTRLLVILGGGAGLCYKALWYFPVLLVIGGFATAVWDLYGRQKVGKMRVKLSRRHSDPQRVAEESITQQSIPLEEQSRPVEGLQKRAVGSQGGNSPANAATPPAVSEAGPTSGDGDAVARTPSVDTRSHAIPVKWGLLIIVGFFGNKHVPISLFPELTFF
jgi:hypothetical protein